MGMSSPLWPLPAPCAYPIPGSRYVGGYMGVGLKGERNAGWSALMGLFLSAHHSSPFPASSRQLGSMETRPHLQCGLHPGCQRLLNP